MRLQLLSDLHLENQPQFQAKPAPEADLLVLAGDVGSYQAGSRLPDDDFGLGRFSPMRGAGWKRVLYVPGNHEYDGLEFADTHRRLQATCEALGIEWLERRSTVIDGVRFVGTTLWADFDGLAPPGAELTQALRQRHKAFRAANFYLSKNTALRDGRPMLAEQMRELGLDCQRWLRNALAVPFDGPTVVVTHFAPSLRSADPRYGLNAGTAGFCNALDALLPRADLWLHGHLHCPHDYEAEGCRVVANPLGYEGKGEQAGFKPAWTIEVPRRS
jgi:predicted phosphodiesterase